MNLPNLDKNLLFQDTESDDDFLDTDAQLIISHRYLTSLSIIKNKRILEIGLGSGYGKDILSQASKSYVGTDLLMENILNTSNSKNIVNCDAHYLPFKEKSFDSVIALAMIYYLNADLFLREVARVLNKSGEIFFCTSNKSVPGFVPSRNTVEYFSLTEWIDILDLHEFDVDVYGVFPASRSMAFLNLKSLLKSLIKNILYILGDSLWEKFKSLFFKKKKLEKNFIKRATERIELTSLDKLNKNRNNYRYRVLYFHAKKRY